MHNQPYELPTDTKRTRWASLLTDTTEYDTERRQRLDQLVRGKMNLLSQATYDTRVAAATAIADQTHNIVMQGIEGQQRTATRVSGRGGLPYMKRFKYGVESVTGLGYRAPSPV